jgi:hypothetical protein
MDKFLKEAFLMASNYYDFLTEEEKNNFSMTECKNIAFERIYECYERERKENCEHDFANHYETEICIHCGYIKD